MTNDVESILRQFPLGRVSHVQPVSAGGLSGSPVYRVQAECGAFALKQVPLSVSDDKLAEIHGVLKRAREAGCRVLAVPIETHSGAVCARRGRDRFELSPWMPGRADFNAQPSVARLRHAMGELARLHGICRRRHSETAVSPGMHQRVAAILQWQDGEIRWREVSSGEPDPSRRALIDRGIRALPALVSRLRQVIPHECLQPRPLHHVVRDLWHDHLLFVGEEVSGLIDFHALGFDAPWLDFVRLVGSLRLSGRPPFEEALAFYCAGREGEVLSLASVQWLHACGVVLGFANWLKWLYVEPRSFSNDDAVQARLHALVEELERLHDDETAFDRAATGSTASHPTFVAAPRIHP